MNYPIWMDEWFETDEPTSCHNCDNDCPGAYLIMRGVADE